VRVLNVPARVFVSHRFQFQNNQHDDGVVITHVGGLSMIQINHRPIQILAVKEISK